MCSWCWAFRPTLAALRASLPKSLGYERLLGGLAPDSQDPMPDDMQRFLQQTWLRIAQQVPGTEFNHEFWQVCRPRRSTYPACRAVIAARQQDADADERMSHAIQRAYYTQARNPSNDSVLIEISGEIGLDAPRFAQDLKHPDTEQRLQDEIQRARRMGANSFPSLVLQTGDSLRSIAVNYVAEEPMSEQILALLD